MRKLTSGPAIAAALTLTAAPALAASPAGDWRGVLQTRQGRTEIALQVRASPEGYRGIYEDLTHDVWRMPLTPIAGGAPGFRIASPAGSFVFGWNAAGGDWGGVWRDKTGAYAMTLRPGVIPPAPLITRGDEILLGLAGGAMLTEAAGIVWLLLLRRRRRLRAAAA